MAKQQRSKKRVAKRKTTRKRSRVVVHRKRVTKRTKRTKRTITRKRTSPKRTRTLKRTPPKRTPKRRPPPASVEYSVNVSYRKSKTPQNAISFQMSVIGPPGRSKDEVIDVLSDTIMSEGEDVKKGWKVKIVSWKGGQVPKDVPWGSLAIIAGEPATRFRLE